MTFSKRLQSNSLSPGKNVRSNITKNFLPREMIFGHGHEQKFRYPYPRDSKRIQMPYPWAKAIDKNPALCPAGLTLIGALQFLTAAFELCPLYCFRKRYVGKMAKSKVANVSRCYMPNLRRYSRSWHYDLSQESSRPLTQSSTGLCHL